MRIHQIVRFFSTTVTRALAFSFLLSGHEILRADVDVWLTTSDRSRAFERTRTLPFVNSGNSSVQIKVDPEVGFQEIDGFGCTLTGGSALHLRGMSEPSRAALLRELFATDGTNIGMSYLRVSVGASDLDERLFSYDDVNPGESDLQLRKFSLAPDRTALLPVLNQILKIAPNLRIMASPWSAPSWMKTNKDTRGGSLKPEYYDVYARYLVRYVEAMKSEGVPIHAVTIQNEPLHPGNNPSMFMDATNQAVFVGRHLGPAFKAANLKTKLIIYDHNADRPDYPITVLNDPVARQFVDGSAFHLYAGPIEALSVVREAHPDKNLYFTEQWTGAPGKFGPDLAWHVKHLTIGATRNWSRTVLQWNLSSNPELKPHTDRGGCDRCLGAVTIAGDRVTRNSAYYVIAHASKFVRPGSVRIQSSSVPGLANVAFRTPDKKFVLIVLNETEKSASFDLVVGKSAAKCSLPPSAVATCVGTLTPGLPGDRR
jgi:glucosylceramidase